MDPHKTELVLTHESFPNEDLRTRYYESWQGCLSHLAEFLSSQKSKKKRTKIRHKTFRRFCSKNNCFSFVCTSFIMHFLAVLI